MMITMITMIKYSLSVDKHTKRYIVDPSPRDPSLAIDYIAMLALATNTASQFTPLVNITGQGFYFNEISCTDQNNCWLAAEGIDKSGGSLSIIIPLIIFNMIFIPLLIIILFI